MCKHYLVFLPLIEIEMVILWYLMGTELTISKLDYASFFGKCKTSRILIGE